MLDYSRPPFPGYYKVFVKDLVWEKKHGPIPEGKKVNHKDGLKHANESWNLMLVDEQDYEGDDDQEFIWVGA